MYQKVLHMVLYIVILIDNIYMQFPLSIVQAELCSFHIIPNIWIHHVSSNSS